MLRIVVFRVAFCVIIPVVLLGQTKKVNLKEAGFLIGTVSESDAHYVIQTKFGPVKVPKDQVVSIEDHLTLREEYRQRAGKIDPSNPEEHFRLGKWAFEREMLVTARNELLEALALKKDYERAKLLLRQVEARLSAAETQVPPREEGDEGDKRPDARGKIDRKWLLTDQEISRIRLDELRRSDTVQVKFSNNVLNRFIEVMRGSGDFEDPRFAATFRRWSRAAQVAYMLKATPRGADDFRKDITITTDPRFMIDFRMRVWPVVARYCATADCHGGTRAVGGFRVFNISGRTRQVEYTNFLIMDTYARHGGRMIDRDRTDSSLLLQLGLPADQAQHPHPGKIPPAYPNRQSQNYRRVREWIESLKGPPHPRYDVKLRVPWLPKPKSVSTTQGVATRPVKTKDPD